MLDAILLPIGEGNRILAQISNGKIDELIAQTYKGDHEKMKLAVNNVAVVLQGLQKELARLTDSIQRWTALRTRQAGAVPGRLCRGGRRRQPDARRHPAAHRRRQPHPGPDFQRQDRRTDRANLQGRPRKDEAGRQQRGRGPAGPAEGIGPPDRGVERWTALRARQAGAVPGRLRRDRVGGVNQMLDAILLPIGEGNRILAQISNGKIDELIAQTYKGDHEKMKQAVNTLAVVLQSLTEDTNMLTKAAWRASYRPAPNANKHQGDFRKIVRGRQLHARRGRGTDAGRERDSHQTCRR